MTKQLSIGQLVIGDFEDKRRDSTTYIRDPVLGICGLNRTQRIQSVCPLSSASSSKSLPDRLPYNRTFLSSHPTASNIASVVIPSIGMGTRSIERALPLLKLMVCRIVYVHDTSLESVVISRPHMHKAPSAPAVHTISGGPVAELRAATHVIGAVCPPLSTATTRYPSRSPSHGFHTVHTLSAAPLTRYVWPGSSAPPSLPGGGSIHRTQYTRAVCPTMKSKMPESERASAMFEAVPKAITPSRDQSHTPTVELHPAATYASLLASSPSTAIPSATRISAPSEHS